MQKRRLLVPLIVCAAVVAIYALVGFLVLPPVLTNLARDAVSSEYGRELQIGEIRFNPFTLRLEVDKAALPDADGGPLLAFDRLLIDLELNSIWRRALSFRAIAVDGLAVRAVIRRGGALNLAELQPAAVPGPRPASDEPLPRLFIGELAVTQGRMRFEDRDRPEPFVANVAPIAFRLSNFSTYVDEGEHYELDATLFGASRLQWRGTLKSRPLASAGKFTLSDLPLSRVGSYLGDALPVAVTSGSASLRGSYRLAALAAGLDFVVEGAEIDAASLAVRPLGEESDYVTLDRISAKGLKFSLAAETAEVGEIAVTGGSVNAWLSPSGELNLAALAGPPESQAADAETGDAPGPAVTATDGGWQLRVPAIGVREIALNFEDRSLAPAPAFVLQPLNLAVEGFSTQAGTSVKTVLDTVVNGKGSVSVVATTSMDSLATEADVEISGIELADAQPYIGQQTSLELTGGALSAKGQLTYADASPAAEFGFKGDVSIDRLHTVDTALREDFVKWQALRLAGIEYRSVPERLRIQSIDVRSPFARLIIGPDGTTNVAAVLAGPGALAGAPEGPTLGPAESREEPPAVVTNPEAESRAGTPFPVRIGTVTITDGSARFADLTTRPNFDIGIGKLAGSIKGLSSDPASRARVELDGQVGNSSPVTIRGDVNPLAAETFLDMAMTFRNVELASFTPYAGRFAGYAIRQGKLSVDLNYEVEDRKLDADHKFVIDQLELGDKVDSPDAVSLPLKLAVALLKDRDGKIDLALPVQGDLDDPEFRVGPIVWKVFVNLLTKAVSAPFALLGNLFGGGAEINLIAFQPGDATLAAASEEKLAAVAKALVERPGLRLSVPAVFSRGPDVPALQEAAQRRQLVRAHKAELKAKKQQPSDDVDYAVLASDPENHLRLLEAAYRKKSETDAEPAVEPPEDADTATKISWLETALRERIVVSDTELFSLARSRAEAVQSTLLGDTGIDPGRVFLVAPAEGTTSDSGVVMELSLK